MPVVSVLQTLVIKVCGVILSVVGGLAVGKVMCTKRSLAVPLACGHLLPAHVPQPVPVWGGPLSDFPVLFLGLLAKVTAVARLGDLPRLAVPQSQPG